MKDDEECPVEFIRKKHTRKGKVEYLVRWEGYPKEYDEWLSEEAMGNAQDLINEFNKHGSRARKA